VWPWVWFSERSLILARVRVRVLRGIGKN